MSIRRPPSFAPRWSTLVVAGALAGCVVAPPPRPAWREAPAVPPPPAAQTAVYFYPEHGQDAERQDRDRFECYQWARQQTGIDPGMTPVRGRPVPVAPPPQAAPGAGTAVGVVGGAAVGAAVSSPWHSGEGMVIGALLGGLVGAASDQARAEQNERLYDARVQAAQAEQARAQAPVREFRRAMGTCMAGRGYTIG